MREDNHPHKILTALILLKRIVSLHLCSRLRYSLLASHVRT